MKIHKTAMIEEGVRIGAHSAIWDNVHIRRNAVLGHHVIVGEKSYIAYDVRIGNFVKINAFVYIPTGITIEDKVMVSAGVVFANDKYPRAFDEKRGTLFSSEPDEKTLKTLVREGATIGAGAVILGGLQIGRFSLVGAGSVVTRPVKDYSIVAGNPARLVGWICVCGEPLRSKRKEKHCVSCGRRYRLAGSGLVIN